MEDSEGDVIVVSIVCAQLTPFSRVLPLRNRDYETGGQEGVGVFRIIGEICECV